jgi:hypothetical protein
MCGWTPEGGPREVRSTGRGVLCCGGVIVLFGRNDCFIRETLLGKLCIADGAPSPSRASNQGHL